MSQKQPWEGGSEFEPKENNKNEHCGKSNHLLRRRRYLHSNQLHVYGGSHHQCPLYQWKDQEKNKFEQASNGKFDKNHKRLGSFNHHKSYATVDSSLSSSAVWVQKKADKWKTEDTMDSKKDECISDQPNYVQALSGNFGQNQQIEIL